MNCQTAARYLPELLDARTSTSGADYLVSARSHLAHCAACQREYAALAQTLTALDTLSSPAPSAKLRDDFYAMLDEEKRAAVNARPAQSTRPKRRRWSRWILGPLGAGALLSLGFAAGARFRAAPATVAATPAAVADPETKRELHELRLKVDRMEALDELVAATFQQQQRPANDRLNKVLTSATIENPSERIINELITSLALDSSPNVRLRALDALYPHARSEFVRAAVVTSLPRESSPVVQVAMIDFLTAARDHEARPALERMTSNETVDENVRVAARRALAQL